ncbi:tyrosine-type recombinase/integrase [Helicobacter sp. 13S00477-4]|uniref:tyrosine-type recombinase/integrase n=1 Tax=Helicobacter sp. 13S00477-4 TaxID=1905759 RepID=UPI000BA5B0EB|nr:tyrosine-type recombinase/integrase [Helicobacter sp. 13S00477-4]PAF50476.1 hypothetical protein BKH44_08165 [Helicobacter sp. 13S00477-4]
MKKINTKELSKEFLEEIKCFYDFKSKVLSKYSIKNMESFKEFQSQILSLKNMQEVIKMRLKLHQLGMIGIKSYIIIEKLYFYVLENAITLQIPALKFFKENHLIDFIYQKSLNHKASSVNLYKTVLGDFFRFLDKKRGYNFDFNLKGLVFNKSKPLPKYLEKNKFLSLIQYLQNTKFTKDNDKKNRLILLLIALSGMRSAEVRNLKLSDLQISYKDGEEFYSICITGKGNKQRKAGIRKDLIEKYLYEWLNCNLCKRKYNKEYLFINPLQKGTDTTRRFLLKTLKELKFIKEKENTGLHMLRHSFASYIYDNTKDIILTQNLLGHSNIETTKIYVHSTTDFSKQILHLF